MQARKILALVLAFAALLAGSGVFYYFVLVLPKSSPQVDVVDATLKCNQLYELKKAKYWGDEIGQSRAIYSRNLGTCLAMNIYYDPSTGDYSSTVFDMENDATLLSYFDNRSNRYYYDGEDGDQRVDCELAYINFEYNAGGKVFKEYGCEKFDLLDKMFDQIRAMGFKVNGGFSSE